MFYNLIIQHADTGKGIPNVLPQDLSHITEIPAVAIPETSAVAEYERDQGKLTYFTPYALQLNGTNFLFNFLLQVAT